MTRIDGWFRAARQRGAGAWLRLVLLVAGGTLGAMAYHSRDAEPWWKWLVELAAGAALLVLALPWARAAPESGVRRVLRWVIGLVGIAAAGIAAWYGPRRGSEFVALLAGITAVIAFFLARWVPFPQGEVRAMLGESGDDVAPPRRLLHPWLALAAAAAGIAAAALNTTHHLAGALLWLASLILYAAAAWIVAEPPRRDSDPRRRLDGGPQLSPRSAAMALLLVLLLAAALRMTLLDRSPALIDSDEGRLGRYAEKIIAEGFPDVFGIGWNSFPHLSYLVDYMCVPVFGTSNPSLRLSAATMGVLSLVPVFFWVRRWWGNIIALLTILLLAVNHDHIYWSRIGLNNMQQVVVAGLMLAAFARVLQLRRSIDWVWFGFAIGLAFHTYHAAKLFPALLAGATVLLALGIRGFLRRYVAGAAVGALAAVLCFGPLGVTIYHNWNSFFRDTSNRVDLYELTAAHARGNVDQVRGYLGSHVADSLLSFISVPYKQPFFDPFVCVPFLLGIGWMLWRWRDPRHLVVLVWTLGILVIGGMITAYPPNKPRMIGFLPTICLIPALVAGRARSALFRCFPRRADLIAIPLLVIWLGAALYHNFTTEFVYRPWLQRGDIMTAICRAIAANPSPATFYMAGGGQMVDPRIAAIDCMMAPDPQRYPVNLVDDPAIVPIPPSNHGTAVLFVTSFQRGLLPLVRHYYPQAYAETLFSIDDAELMYTFVVPPVEIERNRGLRVTYGSPPRASMSLVGLDALRAPSESAQFPLEATGRGQVWIAAPGAYGFRSRGAVRVDGQGLDEHAPVALSAGWHTLEVSGTLRTATDVVAIEWRLPEAAAWTAIPKAYLNTHPQTHGLLGRFFAQVLPATGADPIGTPPDYTRIDAALSYDWVLETDLAPPPPFAARPSTMEWVGTVTLPEGPTPTLRVEATTPTDVFLNGALVLRTAGDRAATALDAILADVPPHAAILVRTVRLANDDISFWKLHVSWRAPGGEWTAFVDYQPRDLGSTALNAAPRADRSDHADNRPHS